MIDTSKVVLKILVVIRSSRHKFDICYGYDFHKNGDMSQQYLKIYFSVLFRGWCGNFLASFKFNLKRLSGVHVGINLKNMSIKPKYTLSLGIALSLSLSLSLKKKNKLARLIVYTYKLVMRAKASLCFSRRELWPDAKRKKYTLFVSSLENHIFVLFVTFVKIIIYRH